jgi:hypothetical protein
MRPDDALSFLRGLIREGSGLMVESGTELPCRDDLPSKGRID